MNQASMSIKRFAFRLLLFAVVLGFQCAWLLLPEFLGVDAKWAAEIGVIRGDLWEKLAFTYADLIVDDAGAGANLARARSSLDRALADAPHQSGTWLLLAGLASRYQLPGIDAKEAIKMSYYTGPSELQLMPLRLRITAYSGAFDDAELRDSISREVRLLITRQEKSAIVAAYNVAQPAGKRFIEQAVREIDPSALEWIRASTQK